MDAAVALQRKKTIKILSTVDFSLSKQGIFFVTLRQKDPQLRLWILFYCLIFPQNSELWQGSGPFS